MMKCVQAIIDDKNRMEHMIEKSDLDWTIVRCTTIKDKPSKGKIISSLNGKGIKYNKNCVASWATHDPNLSPQTVIL